MSVTLISAEELLPVHPALAEAALPMHPGPAEAALPMHPGPAEAALPMHPGPAEAALPVQPLPKRAARKKRPRPSSAPNASNAMHTVLRCLTGQSTRATLTVPEADEECPLTLSPISEDCLDFLPGVRFLLPLPEYTKLSLPCGHGFGAMNLLYHFARRDMRCPCCRAGHEKKLDVDCVPMHFRTRFVARVEQAAREDRDEMEAADAQVARAANAQEAFGWGNMAARVGAGGGFAVVDLTDVSTFDPINLSVYFHSSAFPTGPVTSMEFRLVNSAAPGAGDMFEQVRPHPNATPSTGIYHFVPLADRTIISEQFQDPSVTSISLVAHARSAFDGSVVELARTPAFPVREDACPFDVTRVIRATHDSYFDVSTQHSPFRLQCIVWRFAPVRPRTLILLI